MTDANAGAQREPGPAGRLRGTTRILSRLPVLCATADWKKRADDELDCRSKPAHALRLLQAGAAIDATLQQFDVNSDVSAVLCSDDALHAALRLLEAGSAVDVTDGAGRTALHAAAEVGACGGALVEALLARGAAPARPDSAGDTPLVLASRNGHAQVLALLSISAIMQAGLR